MKGILDELGVREQSVHIFCDSQSTLHITKHHVFHDKSKHIDVKFHFVRDIVDKGLIAMENVSTHDNVANALTKVIPSSKFNYCLQLMGLC